MPTCLSPSGWGAHRAPPTRSTAPARPSLRSREGRRCAAWPSGGSGGELGTLAFLPSTPGTLLRAQGCPVASTVSPTLAGFGPCGHRRETGRRMAAEARRLGLRSLPTPAGAVKTWWPLALVNRPLHAVPVCGPQASSAPGLETPHGFHPQGPHGT